MKRLCLLFLLAVLFLYVNVFPGETSDIMKISEIKPGMKGIGKTIFKGSRIETFDFEVLGFLENFLPNKKLIIVKLKSAVLNQNGVFAGMSGSPLYIDGKIIGAVAYGLNQFPKTPIAGATPIEDIIKTSEYNNHTVEIDMSDIKINFNDKDNILKIVKLIENELKKRTSFSNAMNISPIKLLSISRGIDPGTCSMLSPLFGSWQDIKISSSLDNKKIIPDNFKISAADAVAIPLIRGDFEYSSSGTVTYVDGKKVYMFGHPFFNLGTVEFPMHKAEIISLLPSYQESAKLAQTKNFIGTVSQDRMSGVQGEIGKKPYMIPLHVFLKNRNSKFKLELVRHPLLTPALAAISLNNIFSAEFKDFGFQSVNVKGRIFVENEKNIIIDELYSGVNTVGEFSNLILAINFFLMNNTEKSVNIQKMDFEMITSEDIKKARITKVLLGKNSFKQGELIDIKIFIQSERSRNKTEIIRVKTPNIRSGDKFYLLVGGKSEMISFDSKNVKSSYFPAKLKYLIRAINNLRKNNRIYVKLFTAAKGLFIKGQEFPDFPESEQNIFKKARITGNISTVRFSTLTEYQLKVPFVIEGQKIFELKVKEK